MTDLFRTRTARTLLLGALLAVSASASARDGRMHGPNGESGSCPDATVETEAPPPIAPKRQPIREKAKSMPMVRSSGDSGARPRWHSVLPGMFR